MLVKGRRQADEQPDALLCPTLICEATPSANWHSGLLAYLFSHLPLTLLRRLPIIPHHFSVFGAAAGVRVAKLLHNPAGFALALMTWAIVAGTARGQQPANPLRPTSGNLLSLPESPTPAYGRKQSLDAAGTVAQSDVWKDEAPRPLAPNVVAAEGNAQQPRSVVPPQFGQPELLPPAETYGLPAEEFGHGPDVGDDWSQHLVHRWFAEPWFSHGDPNDPYRHIGLGQPLMGTSWLNRPMFGGVFLGGVLMNDLISNRVDQSDTGFMGLRLGFDFDHYWGLEGRYAFARPELTDGRGAPLADHSRDYFVDVSLVHYPFGDARWRPYVLLGLGFQTFRFYDDLGQRVSESLFSVPLGTGIKYFYGPWFSLRFDIVDNIAVGNAHVSGMHNVSFLAGVEYRFGGRRQSYFPWHNNTAYW